MGQKINPIGLRLGINRTWDSRWFAGKNEYAKLLHEDIRIREMLMKELKQAAVARIVIERPHKKCRVSIHSARPGVVIGKKGADIDKLPRSVGDHRLRRRHHTSNRKPSSRTTLSPNDRPHSSAASRSAAHERACSRDAPRRRGHRINCSGRSRRGIARWSGIARPRQLHTLRPTLITAPRPRSPPFGTCGVKVWIFKGEILEHDPMAQDKRLAEGERRPFPSRRRLIGITEGMRRKP